MNVMKHAKLDTAQMGAVNRCHRCGSLPIFSKAPCNHGFTVLCPDCKNQAGLVVEYLIKSEADKLCRAWNDTTLHGTFSIMANSNGYQGKISAGSLALIRSLDSYIEQITDNMDELLIRLKNEHNKGIDVDYDICQFVPNETGFELHHITTSRICVYLMCGKLPDDKVE